MCNGCRRVECGVEFDHCDSCTNTLSLTATLHSDTLFFKSLECAWLWFAVSRHCIIWGTDGQTICCHRAALRGLPITDAWVISKGALWNNAKHEKLSPAQWSALDTEAPMHVGVNLSLFLACLGETQWVGPNSGTESTLCKRCDMHLHASSQTYIPVLIGMQTWKHTYRADAYEAFMCERNVHKQPKCPVTRFCSFIQQLVIIVATETLTLQFSWGCSISHLLHTHWLCIINNLLRGEADSKKIASLFVFCTWAVDTKVRRSLVAAQGYCTQSEVSMGKAK